MRQPYPTSVVSTHFRERREHRIFEQLLQSVPGLDEKIAEGSDEHVHHLADLVRRSFCSLDQVPHTNPRFKRALHQPGLMIQKR
jgi:Mn-dependent DtxR family transcriptional regulator